MAKRFTDTEKWKKASFSDLSLKMKLVWIYLCDNCDHAGIWDCNFRLLSFQLGEDVTRQEFDLAFADKVTWLSETKCFVPAFVDFQYGELNDENRAHKSVISRLEKEGASKVLTSPFQGAKEKDKEKDKDKVSSFEGGMGETFLNHDLDDELVNPYLAKVKPEVKAAWIRTYEDRAWVKNELKKAVTWILANPKKAPKSDLARFFNNWLTIGWEKYRKTLPSTHKACLDDLAPLREKYGKAGS